MDHALPWDRIPPAADYHAPASPLQPAAAPLARASAARLASDPDLQALQADLTAIAGLRKEKSVSLNLVHRKAERDGLESARLTRENSRRAAHGEAALKDTAALATLEPPDTLLNEAVRITADWAAQEAAKSAPPRPIPQVAQSQVPTPRR
jgi:hypothetical protein